MRRDIADQHRNVDADPAFSLAQPSFAELFTPKLVTVFREGYNFTNFRSDLMAGLTMAIVALPLDGDRHRLAHHAGAEPLHSIVGASSRC